MSGWVAPDDPAGEHEIDGIDDDVREDEEVAEAVVRRDGGHQGEGAARGEHDPGPFERRAAFDATHHSDRKGDRRAGDDEHLRGRGGRAFQAGDVEKLIEADAEHGVEREEEIVASVADLLVGGQSVDGEEHERRAAYAGEHERGAAQFTKGNLAGDRERREEELHEREYGKHGSTSGHVEL